MPVYDYKGVANDGSNKKGIVEAESVKSARSKLRKDGIFVTDITEKTSKQENVSILKRDLLANVIPVDDISNMTRQLSTLIKAQLPLVDALTAITDQCDNKRLKQIMSEVKQSVKEGTSLNESLSKYPKIFDSIYISMVRAGEASGQLSTVMERLAIYLKKQVKMKNQVQGAMTYPVLMVGFTVIILSVLLLVVVPKIMNLFKDMKKELPLPTRILITTTDILKNHYLEIILVFVALIVIYRWYVRTDNGSFVRDRLLLGFPVLGNILRKVVVSRFATTFETLLKSGVPILQAIDIVKNVVNNKVFERILVEAREAVSEGQPLSSVLRKSKQFPPIVVHMIATGEKSGELENMLQNVSETYESESDTAIQALTSLLEPIMIIVMALAIGFIVMAILLPIMQLNNFK